MPVSGTYRYDIEDNIFKFIMEGRTADNERHSFEVWGKSFDELDTWYYNDHKGKAANGHVGEHRCEDAPFAIRALFIKLCDIAAEERTKYYEELYA